MKRLAALLALSILGVACERAPAPVTPHGADAIPARLGAWQLVLSDGRRLRLNERVVPYDLNTPLFSDYALKLRTVWMPQGASAGYESDRELDFPVGTIISKTFFYEKAAAWSVANFEVTKADREVAFGPANELDLDRYVLIETRLLVRYDDGWRAYPYVWNDAQDEAFLQIAGDQKHVTLVDATSSEDIVYVVPDMNQCGGCHVTDHSAKEIRPIGPRAWQLNRHVDWWDNPETQLENWARHGMLHGFDGAAPQGVRWSAPADATLEQRARAYLDANCAHCHNPRGAADTSALHLNFDAPLDRHYGICKTPVAVGRGSGDRPFDIYPGRPGESILLYRMQHGDPAIAMPELGRSAIHAEGVSVVRDWIASMNGEC